MKVHIVMRCVPYEGDEVVDVYRWKSAADTHAEILQKNEKYGTSFEVYSYKINEDRVKAVKAKVGK